MLRCTVLPESSLSAADRNRLPVFPTPPGSRVRSAAALLRAFFTHAALAGAAPAGRTHAGARRAGAAGRPAASADADLRPAPRPSARGNRPRRLRSHHPGHADRRADAHRRRPERSRLRARQADVGLHPERSGRGRAGHRAHRGLAALRRRQRLRGRPLLGDPAGPHHRQRDAARQHPHRARRQLRLVARHVLRPPQRGPLRGVGGGRPARRAAHQRVAAEPGLEPGVRRLGRPHRGRLGDGGGPALQVAALPRRGSADLGLPGAARQPLEERVVLPDAAVRRTGAARPLPRVAGRHPGRDRSPAGVAAVRGQAVRHRRPDDQPGRLAPDRERDRLGRRGRHQVRGDPGADRRLHRQPRLRAGGGRRAADQPDPLQPLLPREARVLPGEPGDVPLRRRGRPAGVWPGRPTRPCSSTAAASA